MRMPYAFGVAAIALQMGGCGLIQKSEPRVPAIERLPAPSVSTLSPPPPSRPAPTSASRRDLPSAVSKTSGRIDNVPVKGMAAIAPTKSGTNASPMRSAQIDGRALAMGLLPGHVTDSAGWATDLAAVFDALCLPATVENLCAAVAVIGQESGFQADPMVPCLSRLAWGEIEKRREKLGIPRAVLDTALALRSPDGRTYKTRLDAVRTERELSRVFEDFVAMVPLGDRLLGRYNPVRTGGPMQVSVAFAEEFARGRPYPFSREGNLRSEVFARRGGLYFGVAHLLNYLAPYERPIYRFADFNAGRFASRNAAFQNAVSALSGHRLVPDRDLLRYDGDEPAQDASETQKAVLALSARLELNQAETLRALRLEKAEGFERTTLYRRVFALSDRVSGARLPRAALPEIKLNGPKIQRNYLTTAWFAKRVETRYRNCLSQGAGTLATERSYSRMSTLASR